MLIFIHHLKCHTERLRSFVQLFMLFVQAYKSNNDVILQHILNDRTMINRLLSTIIIGTCSFLGMVSCASSTSQENNKDSLKISADMKTDGKKLIVFCSDSSELSGRHTDMPDTITAEIAER